jgi:hypothetical protein|tara:strand:- start:5534 stop:6307 length:774 start_codon:yes stop_codon:yes gene_type:complete
MSSHSGPYIQNDGCILHLDAGNPASYPGSGNSWINMSRDTVADPTPASGFNAQCQWNSNGYFQINSNIDNPQANAIQTSTNNSHIYHSVPSQYRMNNTTQKRSYEAWFRVTSLSDTRNGPVFRTMTGTGCSYGCNGGIEIISGKIKGVHYNTTDGYRLDGNVNVVENTWYHCVMTFNPDENPNKRVYINGELDATFQTVGWAYGSGAVYYEIGFNRKSNSPKTFCGDIAVVKWYMDKALTADEVYENWSALKGRFGY